MILAPKDSIPDLDRTHLKWPSPDPKETRGISVRISSWEGIGIGAKHWNVRVEEEDNSCWSEEEGSWVREYGSLHLQGLHMTANMLSEQAAIDVARAYIDITFGNPHPGHHEDWYGGEYDRYSHTSAGGGE